jgi:hypothetical protein
MAVSKETKPDLSALTQYQPVPRLERAWPRPLLLPLRSLQQACWYQLYRQEPPFQHQPAAWPGLAVAVAD